MKCQRCGERDAAVKIVRIDNNIREEIFLCEQCAAETGQLNLLGNEGLGRLGGMLAGAMSGNQPMG
ncbi:MAG: hypothetical protein RR051_04535, partial [Clostridiales bacterium]